MVAVATLKKDGMFFVLGLLVGIFTFSETIDRIFNDFWNSSFMGRFTLPELFGLPTGVVVFAIVVVALLLLWGAEAIEKMMGGEKPKKEDRKYKLAGVAVLVAVALAVVFIGQPTVVGKWEQIAAEKQPLLDNRDVYVHPVEVLDYIANDRVDVMLLDVRDEADYNLFHVGDTQRVSLNDLSTLAQQDLVQRPANTLFVVMSNDEARATDAWKILEAESVSNVYILEGGVNNWLDVFNVEPPASGGVAVAMAPSPNPAAVPDTDTLRYNFPAALGAQYPAAYPEPHEFEDIEYTPKVVLEIKQATGGG